MALVSYYQYEGDMLARETSIPLIPIELSVETDIVAPPAGPSDVRVQLIPVPELIHESVVKLSPIVAQHSDMIPPLASLIAAYATTVNISGAAAPSDTPAATSSSSTALLFEKYQIIPHLVADEKHNHLSSDDILNQINESFAPADFHYTSIPTIRYPRI